MLPKLEVNNFSGSYKDWRKWWTAFDVMVHSTTLDKRTKFKILKLKLEDEVADSISYLDENLESSYDTALKKLRQRFERKDLEANRHLDAVYNLQPVTKIEDYKGLRRLHNQAMGHAMALGKPNVKSDLNARLMQLILRKLPLKMYSDWNSALRAASGDMYASPDQHTLEDLLDYIDGVAADYELAAESYAVSATTKVKEVIEKIKVVEATHATVSELAITGSATPKSKQKSKCQFCKSDSHYAVNCSLTQQQRFEIARKEKRCARCLNIGHWRPQCRSKTRCSNCNKTHHTALCRNDEITEESDDQEAEQQAEDKDVKVESNATKSADSVLTSCTVTSMKPSCLSSKLFGGVFVKSATVFIQGPMQTQKALCLVDDGADACLIKKELAHRLNLKSIGKVPLNVKAVGKRHPEQKYEVFEFSIRDTFTNAPSFKVTAIGYDQIANVNALSQTSFVKALVANDFQLADERLSRGDAPEADIELLLGANAIWQIMKNRLISADGMCAQESALGWLLIGQDQEAKEASQNLILASTSEAASAIESYDCDTQKLTSDNKVSFDLKLCFNSSLHPSPHMNPNALCCFRLDPIASVADIQKAFLQIKLKKERNKAIRFLWQYAEPPTESKIIRVEGFAHEYTNAVKVLSKEALVENTLRTIPNLECANRMLHQLIQLFGVAKMVVHRMVTNNNEFKVVLKETKCTTMKHSRTSLWRAGPSWLLQPQEHWPKPVELTMDEKLIAGREAKIKIVTIATLNEEHSSRIAKFDSRYGTVSKFKVPCFILRPIRNARNEERRRKNLIVLDFVPLYAAPDEIVTIQVSDIVAANLAGGEKRLIRATQRQNLGTKALDSPALLAHMTRVEATVYNRPLAYVSSEEDSYLLIPNLLIIGDRSVADPALSPPKITGDPNFSSSDALNWYHCRIKLSSKGNLQMRTKHLVKLKYCRARSKSTGQPQIGDGKNPKRQKWALSVIEDAIRRADVCIRLVTLRIAGGKHLNCAKETVCSEDMRNACFREQIIDPRQR